jgi:hypothetical protein
MIANNGIGIGIWMIYHGFNQPNGAPFAPRKRVSEKHLPSNLDLSADGFDTWWNRTFAQHTAVIAQASALMHAHQRVTDSTDTRVGQSH